jgi:hypothetical protein
MSAPSALAAASAAQRGQGIVVPPRCCRNAPHILRASGPADRPVGDDLQQVGQVVDPAWRARTAARLRRRGPPVQRQ